jgi:hypothetical protein
MNFSSKELIGQSTFVVLRDCMVGISAIIVWILNNAGGKQEQINS